MNKKLDIEKVGFKAATNFANTGSNILHDEPKAFLKRKRKIKLSLNKFINQKCCQLKN